MTADPRTPPPPDAATPEQVTGVVLAGGMARRMGGQDKGLVVFNGRPLVAWVIDALQSQVPTLIISANRNLEHYRGYGWPVVSDRMENFQGPLAGIASALAAARTPWIVTLPCDGPWPAPDLVGRLCAAQARGSAWIAVAADARRLQPVHALIPRALAADLDAFLADGERRPDRWYARHPTAVVDFSDRPDCFVNLNSPEDAAREAAIPQGGARQAGPDDR